jgi:pyruvate dehydrogenase E1 component beta subunit
MTEEMERDENVFLMGEEVGYYQGAYKISQGMMQRFGERRVIDTPISEAAFAGLGIGAAMVGLRPIVEMMTFNFAILALDQIINNAAKIRYMSGGQLKVPIVFRGPGGAAHALASQHSQALEAQYAHIPGLKVIMPSTPKDAKGLLKSAIRDDNPVIFIESEVMYGSKGEVPDEEYLIPIGVGDNKREGSDVTIVAHSKMVHVALEAASILQKEGIECEVVDPRTIRPLDEELIMKSIQKTNRCVIVEEGWPFAGVGAEFAYRIQRNAFDYLDSPVERVTGADVPTPYAKNLEHEKMPNPPKVVKAVKKVLYVN